MSLTLAWAGKESEEKPGVLSVIGQPMPKKIQKGTGAGVKLQFHCAEARKFEVESGFVAPIVGPKLGAESKTTTTEAEQSSTGKQRVQDYVQGGNEAEANLWVSLNGDNSKKQRRWWRKRRNTEKL